MYVSSSIQAERSARSRGALLEAAVRGLSRYGYGNLNLERVASEAAALIAIARGHALYCRRDVARVATGLRLDFQDRDHPVGRRLEAVSEGFITRCTRLIRAGRRIGTIPPGPPARTVALAFFGALEGTVIQLAGLAPYDEALAARAAAGVLGLGPDAISIQ
jgi:hypothetical protein